MFMFRKKKTNLTKKLLKARKRRVCNEARRSLEEEDDVCYALLKKLEENQLDMLLKAIESRGQDMSNCVLVPRGNGGITGNGDHPHVLCCQEWRWPDLSQCTELRSLPICCSACDPVYICCNPYHWSRLCHPETPPPPYSRSNLDRLKPEDRAPSEVPLVCRDSYPESFSTNGDRTSNAWCNLAYWEQSQRVGHMCPVECSAVNIFGNEPTYGHGICLRNLAQHSFSPPDSPVEKIMRKIGQGITLSLEDGCVWLYNRSELTIFVNSLTLDDPESNPTANPTRVPAEHCLCIYNPLTAALQYKNYAQANLGPIDPNSIKISFAKGWGSNFTRRDITSCPCWLEILLLAPYR